MFRSLSGRVIGLGVIASLVMVISAGLLLQTTDQTRRAFLWVSQNENVIRVADELVGDLREAESGQRGYLLTHSAAYLDTFNERIASAADRGAELGRMTKNDAEQSTRVARLNDVIVSKIDSLRKPLELAKGDHFEDAVAFVAGGRGRSLMEEVARRADEIKASEEGLLKLRMDEAEAQAAWNHQVLLVGGPSAAVFFCIAVFLVVGSFRRPLDQLLVAITALGNGKLDVRAPTDGGLVEFDRLAKAYNDMAAWLASANEHQSASDARLHEVNRELRVRGNAIELLGGMAHRMQAARTDGELAEVLQCFLPRVLPNAPGALYVHNAERNLLARIANWGIDPAGLTDCFAPEECWGLRRGHSHSVGAEGEDVCCRHVGVPSGYHCEPVLAGGEVVGLLYLEGQVTNEDRFRLAALTENVALALVNQRLQKGLREQSIRDPLTNLFNRRYMNEALAASFARCERTGDTLGVAICDIDHFKRFNDEFGHEAGDLVLQAVAAELQAHFGENEVVCRYGGEEFAILVPDARAAELFSRAEGLRLAIRGLRLRYQSRPLDGLTISIGLAVMKEREFDASDLVRRADAALYRAKQAGRDRVMGAEFLPSLIAAE